MSAIFIIGFMTAGKTREGRRLAKLMNRKFIDLDRRIEETENQTVTEIFSTKGEEYFREAESKTLQSLNLNENIIVSCGGGTPCFHDNMLWMLQHGTVVWLKISTVTVLNRIAVSKKERPLLKNLEGGELQNFINEKLRQREPFYALAPIQVDTETISIEKLAEQLSNIV